MRDPLGVEKQFQELLLFLAFPATTRQRFVAIDKFLKELNGDIRQYEPYVLELAHFLPGTIRDFDPIGTPPELALTLLERFNVLERQFPNLLSREDSERSQVMLESAVALQYAFVGKIDKICQLYSKQPPAISEKGLSPLSMLQHLAKSNSLERNEFAPHLERIMEEWRTLIAGGREQAVIPIVERWSLGLESTTGGKLRRVSLDLKAKDGSAVEDTITEMNGRPHSLTIQLKESLFAARTFWNESRRNIRKNRFYSVDIAVGFSDELVEGASAGLAIAALFYTRLVRESGVRNQKSLSSRAAFTGGIDRNGQVLKVDNASLGEKVRAAFYSWVDYLVVPSEQIELAKAHTNSLAQWYPDRNLEVIGVSHLRAVVSDSRLMEDCLFPLLDYLILKAGQAKYTISAITVLLIALLIFAVNSARPIDRNPVSVAFQEESIVVKNHSGEAIKTIRVGSTTVDSGTGSVELRKVRKLVSFFDVDGDGSNELFWVQQPTGVPGGELKFNCMSVRKDSMLWSLEISHKLNFPRKPEITNEAFASVNGFEVDDFLHTGKPELILLASHVFFPSMIIKLDARTGKEIASYVHIGTLGSIAFEDLDGDGFKEIVAAGVNQAFEMASIVVLDPRLVAGHSPLKGDYQINGYEPGAEEFYILLPRTLVGNCFDAISKSNGVTFFDLHSRSKLIEFSVSDVGTQVREFGPAATGRLIYYFNYDLTARSVGTGDDYDRIARKLREEGRISIIPNASYFHEYLQGLLYWSGEKWETKPVRNARFVKRVLPL